MPGELSAQKEKERLRKHFLEARQSLDKDSHRKKSKLIREKVEKTTEFIKARAIHIYVSMSQYNEVDTKPLIQRCFDKKKKVVVPKMQEGGRLNHLELYSMDELQKNSWGVLEPTGNKSFPIDQLDLIVVPMVAGDSQKNRLGYGRGFYDRFLKNCTAPKMGLLFDCQVHKNELPTKNFDVSLDILITESGRID